MNTSQWLLNCNLHLTESAFRKQSQAHEPYKLTKLNINFRHGFQHPITKRNFWHSMAVATVISGDLEGIHIYSMQFLHWCPTRLIAGSFSFCLFTLQLLPRKGYILTGVLYHCSADDTQLIFSFPLSDTIVSAQISGKYLVLAELLHIPEDAAIQGQVIFL